MTHERKSHTASTIIIIINNNIIFSESFFFLSICLSVLPPLMLTLTSFLLKRNIFKEKSFCKSKSSLFLSLSSSSSLQEVFNSIHLISFRCNIYSHGVCVLTTLLSCFLPLVFFPMLPSLTSHSHTFKSPSSFLILLLYVNIHALPAYPPHLPLPSHNPPSSLIPRETERRGDNIFDIPLNAFLSCLDVNLCNTLKNKMTGVSQ